MKNLKVSKRKTYLTIVKPTLPVGFFIFLDKNAMCVFLTSNKNFVNKSFQKAWTR